MFIHVSIIYMFFYIQYFQCIYYNYLLSIPYFSILVVKGKHVLVLLEKDNCHISIERAVNTATIYVPGGGGGGSTDLVYITDGVGGGQ